MTEVDERPQPPGDNACCEGGCEPCVWDLYYAELKQWQAQQDALKKDKESSENHEDKRAI